MFPDYSSLLSSTSMGSPMSFGGSFLQNGGGAAALSGGMGGAGAAMGPEIAGAGAGMMGPAGAVLSGIQTLGALWGAWQQNKMAKKQFKFTKDVTNTNLANQIKSYNTALYDRARSRAVQEGQTDAERDAYINNNSLSRNPKNPAGARDASYVSNYYGASSPVAGSYAAAAAGGGIGAPHPTMTGTSSAAGVGGFSALASRAAAERSRTSNKDDEPATSA